MNTNHHLDIESRPLTEYLQIFRRYKWAILSLTAISTIISVIFASSISPQYKSSARILVEADTRKLLNSQDFQQDINSKSFYRGQIELIRSRSLAIDVINKLRLSNHVDYLPQKPALLKSLLNMGNDGGSVKSRKASIKRAEELVPAFNRLLSVTQGRSNEIFDIEYVSGDAQMAAKVVTEVTREYIKRVELDQEKNRKETIGWLTQNLEVARQKLIESEAELQSYQKEAQVGDSADEARMKSGKLGGITSQLLIARTNRAESEIRYKQLITLPREIKAYESLQYVVANDTIQKLNDKLNDLNRQNAELSQRYGYKHPKIKNLKAKIKVAKERVDREIFRVVDSIKLEYKNAVSREKEVGRIYEQFQNENRSKKSTGFSLAKLEREVDTNRDLYNLLLTRLKEADLTQSSGKISVKILNHADVPLKPFKPNRVRIIGIGFMLGLITGFVFALIYAFNDKTFKTAEDVIEKTKLPMLGIFPILGKKELFDSIPERLIVDRPRSAVSEAVNNIRTNLMFGTNEESPQVIMITSAVASEGKTTVSCNVGISLARLGPTLVIEADTRRPRMKNFMVNKSKLKGGIFEYVSGKVSLRDSVWTDDVVKNLYVMPVMMKPAKPIEFLSSKRFSDALLLMRKKFKYIVIDTPPVLPVSDAIVLASIVDGTLMVVGAESTKYAMTKDALNRLEQANTPMLGTVLSRANPKTFGYYGSNYYYGYGYGYSAY